MKEETHELAELTNCLLRACRLHNGIISPETNLEIWQTMEGSTPELREAACESLELRYVKSMSKAGEYYLFAEGARSLLAISSEETTKISERLVANKVAEGQPAGFSKAVVGFMMIVFVDWMFDSTKPWPHAQVLSAEKKDFIDQVRSAAEKVNADAKRQEEPNTIAEVCEHLLNLPFSTTEEEEADAKLTKSLSGGCNAFLLMLAGYGLVEKKDLQEGYVSPTGKMSALFTEHIANRSRGYETISEIIAREEA